MAKNIKDVISQLPIKEQEAIHARATELINEEVTLRELRKVSGLTQTEIAQRLGVGQDGISRMEKRDDIKLSSLTKWVNAIGGNLRLVVDYDDKPSVNLKIN